MTGFIAVPLFFVVTFHLAKRNGLWVKKVGGITFFAEFEKDDAEDGNPEET